MEKLFELAQDCCTYEEEKEALKEAWLEWCQPGLDLPMELS